jgi:hypothetical protein
MRDVQFLSELLIVLLKGDVGGFDQSEITEYYAKYDDLSDLDFSFDEDQVKKRFELAKKYLLTIERLGSVVSTYARDFNNFYTLWAVIVLHYDDLPLYKLFIKKYSAFMEMVNKYKNDDYLAKVVSGTEKPDDPFSLNYYQNSIGANTEPPQRRERHNALLHVLISKPKNK